MSWLGSLFNSIFSADMVPGAPNGNIAIGKPDADPSQKYVKGDPANVDTISSKNQLAGGKPDADPSQKYAKGDKANVDTVSSKNQLASENLDAELLFKVPDWGYQDFIRERTS